MPRQQHQHCFSNSISRPIASATPALLDGEAFRGPVSLSLHPPLPCFQVVVPQHFRHALIQATPDSARCLTTSLAHPESLAQISTWEPTKGNSTIDTATVRHANVSPNGLTFFDRGIPLPPRFTRRTDSGFAEKSLAGTMNPQHS